MKRLKVIKLLQRQHGVTIDTAEHELDNNVIVDSHCIRAREDMKLKDLTVHRLDEANTVLCMCSMFAAVCTIEDITTTKLIKLDGKVIGAFETHLSADEVLRNLEIEEFR